MARSSRFHEAPEEVIAVEGVARKEIDAWTDSFHGSKADLIRSGVARAREFPGQDGLPKVVVTWWVRWHDEATDWREGGVQITRLLDDRYRIVLWIPAAERERRLSRIAERNRLAAEAKEAVLADLPWGQRVYLESLVKSYGIFSAKAWFQNANFLADQGITPSMAHEVLEGLKVFEAAHDEERLTLSSMREAAEIIGRFRASAA